MAEKKVTKKRAVTAKTPKATPVAIETEPVEVAPQRKTHFDIWAIFWGVVLVAIGVLLLLGNLGLVSVDWSNVWRLWPLLIVIAGFSVLATTHWAWRLLSVLVVIGTLGAVLLFAVGRYEPTDGNLESQQTSVQIDNGVRDAKVELSAGASEIVIGSHADGALADATLVSNRLQLDKRDDRDGDTQSVKLSSEGDGVWWFMPVKNKWDVSVTEKLPLSLVIDSGASSIDADLSSTMLRSLKVNAGASRLDVKLGSKESKLVVKIDSGASSITIRLPKDSGVSLKLDGGLNSKNLADLKSVGEDEFRSDNYDGATKTIDIEADAGVASITIERY